MAEPEDSVGASTPLGSLEAGNAAPRDAPATTADETGVKNLTDSVGPPAPLQVDTTASDGSNSLANTTAQPIPGRQGPMAAAAGAALSQMASGVPVVPFSSYANKGLVVARRIWHSYLLFTASVAVLAVAVSLQLHAFFSFFVGDFVSYTQLALDVLLALMIAAFLAIYITVIWDLLRSAWSGAEYLHVRKLLFASAWAGEGLAIFWDSLVQFLIIAGLDLLPIALGFYYFVMEGFYGFFAGLFGTGTLAALAFGAIIFVLELINGIIELSVSLVSLCLPKNRERRHKRQFGIYTLRARAERAGYQIQRAVATVATRPSLDYWFCYALLSKFAGSRAALSICGFLSIVSIAMCGVATGLKSEPNIWIWISEGVFLFYLIFAWIYGRIWVGAIRVLKLQIRAEVLAQDPQASPRTAQAVVDKSVTELAPLPLPEPTPVEPLAEELGANANFGTLSDPIGRWFARNVEPHLAPAWEQVSVFQPFGSVVDFALSAWLFVSVLMLLIWCSYLMAKTNWLAVIINIYLAVPFLVLVLAYIILMRPKGKPSDGDKDVGNANVAPKVPKNFYSLLKTIEMLLYGLVPSLLLIGLLIWFLATNSTSAGATIGFAILYFLIGFLVILGFRLLAKGFPTKAFLISFGILLFIFLLIFATASTYSEASQSTTAMSSNTSGTPIPATEDPFPYCLLQLANSTLDIVDLSFFTSLAYSSPGNVETDLRTWFGPEWRVAANYSSDPLLFYYEFRRGKVSVVSVQGTQTAVDWMTNLDLWSQVGIFQIADFFIPILRIWPDEWATQMVYFTSPAFFFGRTTGHYLPLIDYVEKLRAEGQDVVLTGHSLGGGLAGIAGTRTRTKTVTFSPPGIFYSRKKFEIPTARALDSSLLSVIIRNDWVSFIDKPAGSVAYLPCSSFPITCHSIVRTSVLFQQACGDPKGRRFNESWNAYQFYS